MTETPCITSPDYVCCLTQPSSLKEAVGCVELTARGQERVPHPPSQDQLTARDSTSLLCLIAPKIPSTCMYYITIQHLGTGYIIRTTIQYSGMLRPSHANVLAESDFTLNTIIHKICTLQSSGSCHTYY